MDDLLRKCKEMCEQTSDQCEYASDEELLVWADQNSLLALFAQKELVYRDQQRVINAMEVPSDG